MNRRPSPATEPSCTIPTLDRVVAVAAVAGGALMGCLPAQHGLAATLGPLAGHLGQGISSVFAPAALEPDGLAAARAMLIHDRSSADATLAQLIASFVVPPPPTTVTVAKTPVYHYPHVAGGMRVIRPYPTPPRPRTVASR